MLISIVIPVLNEEKALQVLLDQLQSYREQGHEVVVVDGGSNDNTCSVASTLCDQLITSESGRAIQMNKGAEFSKNNILWFLHADTLVPEHSIEKIQKALEDNDWGRFNIKLSGSRFVFRVIERMINIRSCVFSIATGDQGIFLNKNTFNKVNGYSVIPLMEDVNLSKKLKSLSHAVCLNEKITTSSRRWEKYGILSTVLLMWKLRFLYWTGVSAERLALQYK